MILTAHPTSIRSTIPYYQVHRIFSRFPIPDSRFPIPDFPTPYSLLPIP
ncbi:hypothetical protein [Moorena producens]|nr:hypothetical protein [Moorena producens]